MAETQSCSNCRYFLQWDEMRGDCRRSAPQVVPKVSVPGVDSRFPEMGSKGWCGEWEWNNPAHNRYRDGRYDEPRPPWLNSDSEK